MQKKRIAIFAENLYGGGVEKILQIICHNFDYERYDVTLYSSRYEDMPQGTYPSHLQHKYYFDPYPHSKTALCGFLAKVINKFKLTVYYHLSPEMFYRLFIRERYDVGIAFIEGYATRIVSGAPDGMKKIAWLHIELDNFHWTDVAYQSREEELACYSKLYKIPCVSQVVKQQADSLFALNDKTIVLHNPIDVERIRSLAKAPLPLPKNIDVVRIVAIGSLDKRKAHDRMLRISERLKAANNKFELLILGKGAEEQNLKNYISEHGLTDCVKMLGYQDNPYPYIASADFYVCSSFAEGYNTAVSEALVLGVPVVSTEVSGIREQLGENSEYGIITDNSEQGLYNGISKMLQDGKIEYYQNKAKERREIFNLQAQMQSIYNLIES